MSAKKRKKNLLGEILKRPALYWGNSDNHFHSFLAFVSGYQMARAKNIFGSVHRQLDQMIPPKFHEFVTEYYGHEFRGSRGWTSFIEEHTSSDAEALQLFLKLRDLCLKRRKKRPRRK
jgi:hypothetical protein